MPFILNFFSILALQSAAGRPTLTPLVIFGAVIVILGLACDAIILNRFLPALDFRITPKAWGMRELVGAVILMLGLFIFSLGAYSLIARFSGKDVEDLIPLIVPAELVLRVGVLLGFIAYFRTTKIDIRHAVGFDRQPVRATGWGVMFGLAALPPIGVIIFANNALFRLLHIPTSDQEIVQVFLKTDSHFLLGTLVVFAVVVAPVFEEFLFRGFAYPVLKQRFGMGAALVIISAVFAVNHLHAPSLAPLFVLALGLGMAYELTGSLMAPIAMHSLFNSIMLVQVFYQRAHPP